MGPAAKGSSIHCKMRQETAPQSRQTALPIINHYQDIGIRLPHRTSLCRQDQPGSTGQRSIMPARIQHASVRRGDSQSGSIDTERQEC